MLSLYSSNNSKPENGVILPLLVPDRIYNHIIFYIFIPALSQTKSEITTVSNGIPHFFLPCASHSDCK